MVTPMVVLVGQAREQLSDVTGLKSVAVTRVEKEGDGYIIGVEMLEMSRIPTSTDVIGEYEVTLAEDGSMLNFIRRRTRLRGETLEAVPQ